MASAIVLTGCSSDVFNDDEGNLDVAVGVSFSISSQLSRPATRLAAGVIQDNNTHRGIQDIYVIPFRATRKIIATDSPVAFTVNGVSSASYDRQQHSNAWFYYYEGCTFARGTASFLAYCRAVKATDPQNSSSEMANKAYNADDIIPKAMPKR